MVVDASACSHFLQEDDAAAMEDALLAVGESLSPP